MKQQSSDGAYSSRDLEGVHIDHSLKDLQAGQAYIMTFKDQEVLGDDPYDDGEDVLENVNLQETFQQRLANRRKSKLKQHQNSKLMPVEDSEARDDWDDGNESRILTKYDDDDELAREGKKKSRIEIGSSDAAVKQSGPRKQTTDKFNQTLAYKKHVVSDYLDATEIDDGATAGSKAFKKKKRAMGSLQIGSKRRHPEDMGDDDIIAQLEKQATTELSSKRARHETLAHEQTEREQTESNRKAGNFKRAFDKVKERANLLQGKPNVADPMLDIDIEDDDYSQIENQLEKQRQLKLKKSKAAHSATENTFIKSLIDNSAKGAEQQAGKDEGPYNVADESQPAHEGLEILKTNEFDANLASITSRLEADAEAKSSVQVASKAPSVTEQFSLQKAKAGYTSVVNVMLPSQKMKSTKPKDLLFASSKTEESKIKDLEQVATTGEDAAMQETKTEIEELIVGKGLGNALKVFRSRGMLGQSSAVTKGRNMDQTLEKQLAAFEKNKDGTQDKDRVNLQYFDSKGRKLTIKEAYRQMCWKFHGRMPSHKKREKMAKKEETALVQSAAANALGSLTGGVSGSSAAKTTKGSALGSLGSRGPPKKSKA